LLSFRNPSARDILVCIDTFNLKARGFSVPLFRDTPLGSIPTDAAALTADCVRATTALRKRIDPTSIMGVQQRLRVLMEKRGAVDGVGFEHLVGFGLHFVLQRRGGTGGVWTSFSTPALEDLRYWQPCLVPRPETPSSAAAGAGAGAFAGAAMVVPPHAGPAAPQPSASAACAARSRAGGPEPSEAHAAPA